MSGLGSIIKNSLSQASSHTKKVYSQNPLTASEVIDLANSRVLTLAATVRLNGRPHLSPTDLVVVDGVFYLGVDEASARYRNLKQNPGVTVMLADGSKRQAIIEGNAKFLDMKSGTAKKVLEALKKKYGWVTDALAEFQPAKAFTWKAK
ncbi:MAG TPA: pyridoxamine 5'-phosphate oxidase family protein [Candidatus Angelobacter sp.]|nr:pyridoxamine 5'-phosphate oxidase family protein [Candidatus Angelobacter sp.]